MTELELELLTLQVKMGGEGVTRKGHTKDIFVLMGLSCIMVEVMAVQNHRRDEIYTDSSFSGKNEGYENCQNPTKICCP